MMWFGLQVLTFSGVVHSNWDESVPPNLKTWFSTGKRWNVSIGFGMHLCLKDCLGVFTYDGRMKREDDRELVVMKELSQNNHSQFTPPFMSQTSYGHGFYIMTKRTRSWQQIAKTLFSLGWLSSAVG